jgi:hypothetical protein
MTVAGILEPPEFQLTIRWLTNRPLPAGRVVAKKTLRKEALRKSVERSCRAYTIAERQSNG